MANVKISELPLADALGGTEQVPVVQGGVTKRAPASALVGPQGPKGDKGDSGEIGPQGPAGPKGDTGAGLTIKGELGSSAALPPTGALGDGYLIAGDLWVWTGTAWENVGQIQGPAGADGREVQLQKSVTHVQWRYAGETTWTNLVALSEITGPQGATGATGATGTAGVDGREIELQKSATHVQWRYAGSGSWTDLVALSEITGPQGLTGPAGTTSWAGITDKPSTFPPSAHTHAIADVTGLQAALDGKSASDHTHANATTTVAGFMSAADKTKLDGVASGATANATDAQLRDRSTHTGTQAISTVTGLQTALDAKLNASGGTASGLTLNNGYTEQVFTLTGTTPALDESNGSIQTWTLSGASTPTDALSSGQSLILGITAGANTITWPSVTWVKVGGSGTAPSLTSTGVNWVILWKVGTTLRGAFLGTA